jgi:hypothetical protein
MADQGIVEGGGDVRVLRSSAPHLLLHDGVGKPEKPAIELVARWRLLPLAQRPRHGLDHQIVRLDLARPQIPPRLVILEVAPHRSAQRGEQPFDLPIQGAACGAVGGRRSALGARWRQGRKSAFSRYRSRAPSAERGEEERRASSAIRAPLRLRARLEPLPEVAQAQRHRDQQDTGDDRVASDQPDERESPGGRPHDQQQPQHQRAEAA